MPSSAVPRHRHRKSLALALSAIMLLGIVAVGNAAHWPFYGGDQGRSGYQPVDEGVLPVVQDHAATGPSEENVANSIITTGGPLSGRLYAFGTEAPGTATRSGNVHLHDLETGAHVGLPEGEQIDNSPLDDPDTFRGLEDEEATAAGQTVQNDFRRLEGQGVAFADASTAAGPGVLYAVHNDDDEDATGDIAISQISETDGDEKRSFPVPDSEFFTIASSPVFGPVRPIDANTAQRDLFFVAFRPEQQEPGTPGDPCSNAAMSPDPCRTQETRLFKVTITNPQTTTTSNPFEVATSDPQAFRDVPDGNPLASPSIANLTTTEGQTETTEPYVIQGADNGNVYTYEADSLTPGPIADLNEDGDAQTVSAPVNSDGTTDQSADALFVAVGDDTTSNGGVTFTRNNGTTVYRLRVNPVIAGPDTLVQANDGATATGRSTKLSGSPAVALALDFDADAPQDSGNVVVTTSDNLFVLDANDLRQVERLGFSDSRNAGGNGFSRNTAAVSGGLAFVQEDDGTPLVVDLDDAEIVPDGQFEEFPAHTSSTSAIGQPSLSARHVQFGTDDGVFVYQTSPLTAAVGDVEVLEGNAGTQRTATFTVTLSGASEEAVTVNYATAPSGASPATEGVDYQDATGTLTFAPGETTKTVDVTINGDAVAEPNETFSLTLSSPSSGSLGDATGVGTIVNDDGLVPNPPGIAISDASIAEGNSGTRELTFDVTLSSAVAGQVTVNYATANDTATAGSDYVAESGTVTFPGGNTSQTITITVNGDTTDEELEQFFVNLSNASGANIADAQGVGSIADDDEPTPETPKTPDAPPAPPAAAVLGVDDVVVNETDGPGTATFTVSLSRALTSPVTVDFGTAPGSATTPGDFTGAAGKLTFAAGETTKTVAVPIVGDDVTEGTEVFSLRIGNPTNAVIGDGAGAGTIVDDDIVPRVVEPARVNPRGISATTTPRRDRTVPFRFRTTGRVLLPARVPRSSACIGVVSVQIKRGSNTVSTRRAEVRSDCTFASTVTFADRRRLGKGSARLKVTVRFLGNPRLNRVTSTPQFVRFD